MDLIFLQTIIVAVTIGIFGYFFKKYFQVNNANENLGVKIKATRPNDPLSLLLSVNFHFTRKCNYTCGFCFHTAKTTHLTPLEDAKLGLQKLADKGMRKLNFSGGEPFLHAEHLGQLCKFAKEVLELESVSIVSNGSKVQRKFFTKYATYVDILAISVDSFDEDTNVKIGRGESKRRGENILSFLKMQTLGYIYLF